MFWRNFDVKKLSDKGLPQELKYIASEPLENKNFVEFLILTRWAWALMLIISFVILINSSLHDAIVAMCIMLSIWHIIFKVIYKKIEKSLNLAKDSLKKLKQTLFGY